MSGCLGRASETSGNASNKFILPRPTMNIVNGGKHGDWGADFQEFMIIPMETNNFSETLQIGTQISYFFN